MQKEGDINKSPTVRQHHGAKNRNNPIHTIKGQHDYNGHADLLQRLKVRKGRKIWQ